MAFIQPLSVNAWQPMYCLVSYECKEQPGRQPASLSSRLAMCKRAPSSQPAASDLPDAASIPAPPEMHGHLIVDILTLAFVVVAAVLFLSIKVWLRRRAAAAKRAADLEAEKAAALSVKTQGTMTDSLFFQNQFFPARGKTTTRGTSRSRPTTPRTPRTRGTGSSVPQPSILRMTTTLSILPTTFFCF